MSSSETDSGYRNLLGFYDKVAKEIVLRRPCIKKKDAQEAFSWVEEARTEGVLKVVMGVGAIECFINEDSLDSIYTSARAVIKEIVEKNKFSDANLLVEVLIRLEKCPDLRHLCLRCFSFINEPLMFDMLLRAIKSHNKLRILDLAGCFFEPEQLFELANVLADSYVSNIIWPEPDLDEALVAELADILKVNMGLVVADGASREIQKVVRANRKRLFDMASMPMALSREQVAKFKEYADSVGLALSYEQQKLIELQKSIEVILALH
ncbi:MAG: hypothetical protein IKW39_04145 [Alphaproteobacteria bacterium]|nr:hypothetical protein [Alphaproteobacteria bacterium]